MGQVMQVAEVRVFAQPLPVVGGYSMSGSVVDTPVSTIVEVQTHCGLVGQGEVCMATDQAQPATNDSIRTALDRLAPALIGTDPSKPTVVAHRLAGVLDGHREAKAAIDIACWDLLGHHVGLPISALLGGALVERVPTYHVVGIAAPEVAAEQAARLQDDGIRALQLKAGGRPIAADIESIRAVSSVLGPHTQLAVDANRGWTTSEARLVSNACRDVTMSIEQPCHSYAENASLRSLLCHPLILDESMVDVAAVSGAITGGVVDGLGMKMSRVGGLSAMRAVRDLCAATSTPTSCDDAWGGDIIAAACVQLGSTIDPRLNRGIWIAQPYVGMHYDEDNGPRIVGGHIPLPPGPGLGLRIAPDRFGTPVAAYR